MTLQDVRELPEVPESHVVMLGWGNPSLLSPNLACHLGSWLPPLPQREARWLEVPGARTFGNGKAGSELPTTWWSVGSPTCVSLGEMAASLGPTPSALSGVTCWVTSRNQVRCCFISVVSAHVHTTLLLSQEKVVAQTQRAVFALLFLPLLTTAMDCSPCPLQPPAPWHWGPHPGPPALVPLIRQDHSRGGYQVQLPEHRGPGWLNWQWLLWHWYDHRHRLCPAPDHRDCRCHHYYRSKVRAQEEAAWEDGAGTDQLAEN